MRIGIIGGGNIGGTLGKLWADAGHDIVFGTRRPEALKDLISEIGPQATAGTPADAAMFGDTLLFAAPYSAWPLFAKENAHVLTSKTVVDAANPYAQRDGSIVDEVAKKGLGAGGFTASLLPTAQVVKAFNTIFWSELREQAHRPGERLAIPIAGRGKAADIAVQLAKDAGFDSVVIGDLSQAKLLDPGSSIYGESMTATEIKRRIGI